MRSLRRAKIMGTGMYLPEKRLTNADLEKMVDTTDEWIVTRSGIKERRIAEPNQAVSDLAVPAAQMALKNAGVTPEQIGCVILASFTPDRTISATACIIQHKLGCKNAGAFDIEVACSGFIYATTLGRSLIETHVCDYVLVIGADILSKVIDFTDRNTCVLFGDGAGAVVLGPSASEDEGIFDVLLGADGGGADHITIPAGGTQMPTTVKTVEDRLHYVKINGKEVFKFSTKIVGDMIEQVLTRNNLTLDNVKLIIPHQANIRIIESAAKRFNCPMDKFFINLDRYGNTVAGTIPIGLHEALGEGKINKGDIVLLAGFGGGLTWGLVAMKW
ncbi:MAG TPA: beta-ketoacyl-ACP synthase III [Candidatus Wallbacteria bacterium]|nr:MAG: 3-oxoacyl-(acyl-carrier-protein) synthase 3 [bacterium ADurb.Bin243]HPG57145.1 beta-ketoacyl-ACP synthase III [Candidatus Wallbacteria bacterium]